MQLGSAPMLEYVHKLDGSEHFFCFYTWWPTAARTSGQTLKARGWPGKWSMSGWSGDFDNSAHLCSVFRVSIPAVRWTLAISSRISPWTRTGQMSWRQWRIDYPKAWKKKNINNSGIWPAKHSPKQNHNDWVL